MFDGGETAEDFARIADAGFDSVRVFLLWEAFQPRADRVDPAMLERLVAVADAAERAGLDVVPTLFTGHMSGVNWIPAWALGGTERDARFRVVSEGRVVPGRAAELVPRRRPDGRAGAAGEPGRGGPRGTRSVVGVGPGERELELRRSRRSRARATMAVAHDVVDPSGRPRREGHHRDPHGGPGAGSPTGTA